MDNPDPLNALIRAIEIFPLNIPLSEPFVFALETITHAENILVRIHTDTGLTGEGECSPYRSILGETQAGCMAVAVDLAKVLKGKNAGAIQDNLIAMDKRIGRNACIKSAFDMALYDLAAQIAGLPLYAFLGGQNNRMLATDMTVSIGIPEKMASDAKRFLKEGFEAIKVKLGGTTKEDVNRIQAIREAIGYGPPLRIDANQGWDVVTAIQTLNALQSYQIEHCEQPIAHWNILGMADVRRRSPIPIMADESLFGPHDAMNLLRLEACDFFNIKLAKSGGIGSALKIHAIAEASGITCQVGCFSETRLAMTALAHLALACPGVHYIDMDAPLMLAADPVDGGIHYSKGGRITLSDTPGLGARIHPKFLAESEKVVI